MFRTGEIIDGYRIEAVAGSGSYGTVYKAVNQLTEQPVALKVIPVQGAGSDRELRALKLCQQLVHPNLIRIHHAGITPDGIFIFYTMDWADGGTVADRTFKAAELKTLAVKLLSALEMLHKNGLIHRDIKPENILLIRGEPVLADVGLMAGGGSISLVGTPGFIPIDVMSGKTEPDAYSDVYAFAKTLYVLLTGKKPGDFPDYDGSFSDGASELLCALCCVCEKNTSIHTARDFLNLLIPGSPQKKRPVRYGGRSFKKILLTAGGMLILAAILLLGYYLGKSGRKEPVVVPPPAVSAPADNTAFPEKREPEYHPTEAPPVKLQSFQNMGMDLYK